MAGEGQPPAANVQLPFDGEFQKSLLRLLCEDSRFGHAIGEHLEPRFFEAEALRWAWSYALRFKEQYGAFPGVHTILQQTRMMDPKIRPIYEVALEQVRQAPLKDEAWMRDAVLDFVKRNLFVRTFQEARGLYNTGKVEKAYDLMMNRMERLQQTTWSASDESWFFEELADRQVRRMTDDPSAKAVATGFPNLDHILNGGLSKGELGLWVAYAKTGKSTMLAQQGMAATRLQLRHTAHFVFEGSRQQVEDRYESGFTEELYRTIRTEGLTSAKYQEAYQNYKMMARCLYIRGFTSEWHYSCADVHESLKDLKRLHGWTPDLVIVDYGDLLNGRGTYANDRENQKAAFRDLKSLANRGYAVWSASQAQRPEKGAENDGHWLYARQIADCYEKVRVADFLGSLNITNEERKACVMRLYGELYRDNEADKGWVVRCNFATMTIKSDPKAVSPSMPDVPAEGALMTSPHQQKRQRQPVAANPVPVPQPMTAPLR
jgi:hypothetical protein